MAAGPSCCIATLLVAACSIGARAWQQVKPSWASASAGCARLVRVTDVSHPDSDEEIVDDIRAVRYWPEPIGYKFAFANNTGRDPYTPAYADLHSRDLPMIRYELGANTLLLGAWSLDDVSHFGFARTARESSLTIIPAFDIGWYWREGNWRHQATRSSLEMDFRKFLENGADRTVDMRPFTLDSVLMFNIVGLPDVTMLLPRGCVAAAVPDVAQFSNCVTSNPDLADAVASMGELQDILEIIRLQQKRFFCTAGPSRPEACDQPDDRAGVFTFDRPLALTIELGAEFSLAFGGNIEYLRSLVFWMERVLGCRRVSQGQVEVSVSLNATRQRCRFHGNGFFDAWILKVITATSHQEAASVQRLVEVFSPPRFLPEGTSPAPLKNVSGSMKPVVFEYGFSALAAEGTLDADVQHQLVSQVWRGAPGDADIPNIQDARSQGLCVSGAALDEWMDVWSRPSRYYECTVLPQSDLAHSPCGPVTDGGAVAVGYVGLMGQFNTLMMHCLEERAGIYRFSFLSAEEASALQASAGYSTPRLCRFVALRPGLRLVVFLAAVLGVLLLTCISCCLECRRRRAPEAQGESSSDHNLSLASQTEASKRRLEEMDSMPYSKNLAMMVANALGDESLRAEIPIRYSHIVGYSGWGLAKVNGKFSYHRLQYHGRGRGETVQSWETEVEFIRWLQEQSDRSMAVYSFTEEELRRTDMIGNKTITRQQLLEMLDATGSFREFGPVVGVGHARMDCFGRPWAISVRLKYRASPAFLSSVIEDGPKLDRFSDVATWRGAVEDHMQKFLEVMATTHLQVQADRLRRQTEHEAQALLADAERRQADEAADAPPRARAATRWRIPTAQEGAAFKRACYNVWRRALEGVHKWQELHRLQVDVEYCDEQFQSYFAEALLLRLCESLGEHLVHSPEWLASVFQKNQSSFQMMHASEAQERLHLEYDVDNRNEQTPASQELAFIIGYDIDYDDLCEPLNEFVQNSNVFASKKQGINFDDINDRGLLAAGHALPRKVTKTYREPIGLRVLFNNLVNFKWPMTMVLWLFSFALIMRESSAYEHFTGRVSPDGDKRVTLYLVVVVDLLWLCVVSLCSLWVDTPISFQSIRRPCCRYPRLYSALVLAVLLPLLTAAIAVEADWDLEGVLPSQVQDDDVVRRVRGMWFVPVAVVLTRLTFGLLPKQGSFCIRSPCGRDKRNRRRIAFFWGVFGLMCFLSYYAVIIDLVRPLTPRALCQLGDEDEDFCNTRVMELGLGLPPLPTKDSQCVACITSVAIAWTLGFLGCMMAPYFIFNACVSLMGSSLGVARGLVETNVKVLDMSVHSLSSDFSAKRKAEAVWLSHGTVLSAVYGREWQRVWLAMVDGLFDDCFIDSEVRAKLLDAAKKGKKVDLTDMSPGRVLSHAVRRIGYLFASHRAILADQRISFTPYQGSDRDVHCDALGITHPGRIPSLTQIIPVYGEEGIMGMKELLDKGKQQSATASTLEFIISQFPEEWRIFAETAHERGLGDRPFHPTELHEMLSIGECSTAQQDKVREWASDRAQSVLRTVSGAVHYHCALQILLRRGDGVGFDDMRRRVQLILAHQTYGKISLEKATKAHLRNGVLTFRDAHGLVPGDSVRLRLSAKQTLDFKTAFALSKVVDKFKERLANRRGDGESRSQSTASRSSSATRHTPSGEPAASAERPINIVFSMTIVNVDSAALLASREVMEALVTGIKQAIVIEAADNIVASDIQLVVSATDGPELSAARRGVDADFGSGVSVECTIQPPHGGAFIWVIDALASSSSLRHTLAAAISECKHIETVALAGGSVRLDEVGAVSRRSTPVARSGSGFKNFKSGKFYTVEKIVNDHTVVLAGTAASCGQVLLEKVAASKRDQDVHYMLRKHKGYPFFVCIDFHRGKTHPRLAELIDEHVENLYQAGTQDSHPGRGFKYASVLLKYRYYRVGSRDTGDDHWPVEVVHVLPRARGLLIGSEGNLSQGKSGNQLGALRFSEGHFLQMMDANMGCYAGETFKVPVVLQGFYKQATGNTGEHRLALRTRIIGFREHIFTRSHGLVGKIMADAEWTFGTLVQRMLGFLNVRMHYGHPDFMDCFWACSRGSVSKASPHINLSEDIFAGLNVNSRQERSVHTDVLEWEKGREVQFCAGSGFFWKIASGSVGLMRTRDLRVLCGRASIMQSLALYFATIAWYVHNILVDYGTEVYVMLFVVLTLGSKNLNDLGALGSALAVEWFITPAFSAILPAVVGFGVEYGPWWLLTQYIPTIPASVVYFIFINKSMASSVRATLWANTAEYVNTGRPHANKSYTLLQAFIQFRGSHYVPAVSLLYLVSTYALSNVGGALPMILILITAVCWILAPVLFRPPTEGIAKQFTELAEYILRAPASCEHLLPGRGNSLYEFTLDLERKMAHRDPALQLLSALALGALYLTMAPTTVFEQMPVPFFAWAVTFCTKCVWRLSGAKQAGLLNLVHQLVPPVVLLLSGGFVENARVGTMLVSLILFAHFMELVKLLVWNISLLVLPRGSPLGYDRVVQITFLYGLRYQMEVYAAFAVLTAQAVCEGLLWLLDLPRLRLRTRVLLNTHVCHGCVPTIFGEACSDKAGSPPKEKKSM